MPPKAVSICKYASVLFIVKKILNIIFKISKQTELTKMTEKGRK